MKRAVCDLCECNLFKLVAPDGLVRSPDPIGVGYNKYHKGKHLNHDYQRALLLGHYDLCLECIDFILDDIEEYDIRVNEAIEARQKYVRDRCNKRVEDKKGI